MRLQRMSTAAEPRLSGVIAADVRTVRRHVTPTVNGEAARHPVSPT